MKRTILFALASLVAVAVAAPALAATPAKAPEMTQETAMLLVTQRIAAGDLDGAEQALRTTEKKFPSAAGIHLQRGTIAEARKNVRAALWEYQWELLRTGADRPSGAEAMRRSQALVDVGSADAVAVRTVLEAMSAAGADPAAALAAVKSARASGDAFVLRVFETELRASSNDPQAESLFRELLKIDPYFVPAHVGLARTLGRAGKGEAAQAALDAGRAIDPGHWALPRQ